MPPLTPQQFLGGGQAVPVKGSISASEFLGGKPPAVIGHENAFGSALTAADNAIKPVMDYASNSYLNLANDALQTFASYPPIKAASAVVGGATALLGGALGTGVAAVGTPIVNTIKGKPLLTNLDQNMNRTALDTATQGFKAGASAVPSTAAALGGGALLNNALLVGSFKKGITDIHQGVQTNDPELIAQGVTSLSMMLPAAYGLRNGIMQGNLLPLGIGSALEGGISDLGNKISDSASQIREKLSPTPTPADIAGKITRGSTAQDNATAANAFSDPNIDITQNKTYADAASQMNDAIKNNVRALDSSLNNYTDKYTPKDVAQEVPLSGSKIQVDPVQEAITQLQDYYKKTGNVDGQIGMDGYEQTYQTDGLTPKQMNDLARLHGRELNAYNANGELASGLKKQAAENTRTGVKNLVKTLAPDSNIKTLDPLISDQIATRQMLQDQADKVQELQNKMQQAGVMQKVGAKIGDVLQFLSGGLFKGITKSLQGYAGDSNIPNAIQLQNNLQSNSVLLDSLLKMSPEQAASTISSMASPKGEATMPENSLVQEAQKFATAGNDKYYFVRNTENKGGYINGEPSTQGSGQFNQKYEPTGEYMNIVSKRGYDSALPNLQKGTIEFNNPLVIEGDNSPAWKQQLSENYGGLTRNALSQAIKKDGYDAIITMVKSSSGKFYPSEVVNLKNLK